PAAFLHQSGLAATHGRRASPFGSDRDQRLGGHRDGRGGSVSVASVTEKEAGPIFTGETLAELQKILARYPTKQPALLPALWLAQAARGWIPDGAIVEVANVLGLTPAYVRGVVTFYTMYHQHPVGRYFVQVCTTSPCNICGAEDVVKALLEHT